MSRDGKFRRDGVSFVRAGSRWNGGRGKGRGRNVSLLSFTFPVSVESRVRKKEIEKEEGKKKASQECRCLFSSLRPHRTDPHRGGGRHRSLGREGGGREKKKVVWLPSSPYSFQRRCYYNACPSSAFSRGQGRRGEKRGRGEKKKKRKKKN